MQSMNSEYGSPYLAVCHVTFTYVHNIYEFGIQSSEDFFFYKQHHGCTTSISTLTTLLVFI